MDKNRQFKKIKIMLMRSDKFVRLSGIMMMGRTTMTTDIPTACTDGRNEMYNPEFIWQFTEKMVGFIIIHENMHKAGRHLTTYKKLVDIYGHKLVNIALDYWNNNRIKKADPNEELVAMPYLNGKQVGLYDVKYDGWTVLQIIKDLKQEQEDNPDQGEGEGEGEGEGGGGFDDHDWEGASEMSEEEVKKLESDIKQAIRQGQMAAKKMGVGTGAGSDLLGLNELVASKVNWKQQLQEFASSTCTAKQESSWRRPNRRFLHQGIIMPTLISESITELVFTRDASGSMHFGDRLTKVTSEMVAIAKALRIEKIHLIDWDGAVGSHEEFTADTFQYAPSIKQVHGGGGTDPTCVAAYLKEKQIKPDAIIMLTDGEINNWGNWESPILWVIANNTKITAPVGKTINLEEAA
jgi:predicted metal-dependent peptidase